MARASENLTQNRKKCPGILTQRLLDTVRMMGPSARVVIEEGAMEEQTALFQRFQSRLAQGRNVRNGKPAASCKHWIVHQELHRYSHPASEFNERAVNTGCGKDLSDDRTFGPPSYDAAQLCLVVFR
ncbi:hypothetical protein B0H13DRAFT_1911968 [Mycena leptocephala]|nr:hypothetical protein B0H13DRAFT_1911968 [Mycena leptocephala]